MPTWKNTKLKNLAKALKVLKTEEEILAFLRDIATLEELTELANRWDVVLKLQAKKSYRQIAKETNISTTTITRIAHWLNHGEGGYQAALKRISK